MEKMETKSLKRSDSGFTLIEVVIALIVLLVAVLGVFGVFAFSTRLNTGNSGRSQALSVLKQEVELLRAAKFTPATVDATWNVDGRRDITGGVKAARIVNAADGANYRVEVTIDDDPFTAGTQTAATPTAPTMKQILVTVTRQTTQGTWETAIPTRAFFRRVRAN